MATLGRRKFLITGGSATVALAQELDAADPRTPPDQRGMN